jgi:hypothetical protein
MLWRLGGAMRAGQAWQINRPDFLWLITQANDNVFSKML